ncbi:MAG TPA: beta/gamma crystallin-related protein, partial [Usitatibacter sp.]|nr:beta/gamma crystallin-related protein [Usitatibacter sp.]
AVAGLVFTTQAAAEITFYEHDGLQGRSFSATRQVDNFQRNGFNDLASSVVVLMDRWEVCSDADFGGRCVVLRPGRYDSLSALGMNDRISSARIVGSKAHVDGGRYAPAPVSDRDYRRRDNERLYEANVMSVRAVVGAPEQRCWVEHEQVAQDRGGPNVPGAVAGALIGGILGHQVGNGRGNDVATAGGAVVGAVVGSNVGRDHGGQGYQDVQRCSNVPSSGAPEFWDVTYDFQGQEHHVQMTSPPGRTVTVNAQGEPRA